MKKCGRGSVFFVNDFLAYGTRSAVNKALERMVLQGTILRAARGIYCYPKLEKVYGLGAIPPSGEDIAAAVAKRDGAHIVPSGAFAQYQLGLTQQIPLNYHYLTDGTSRTITIDDTRSITFHHVSPRYFAFQTKLAQLITTALKDWKIERLTDEQIQTLKTTINNQVRIPVADLKLMPTATRELILSLYE
jgi:hypothetical protein